jgi:hypothetical protein
MKPILILIVATTLCACTGGPRLGVGIGIGPGGVSVNPKVSGSIGGVSTTVSP